MEIAAYLDNKERRQKHKKWIVCFLQKMKETTGKYTKAAGDGLRPSDADHLGACQPIGNAKAEQEYLSREIEGDQMSIWTDEKTWVGLLHAKPNIDELWEMVAEENTTAVYLFTERPNGDCWTFLVTSEYSCMFSEYFAVDNAVDQLS